MRVDRPFCLAFLLTIVTLLPGAEAGAEKLSIACKSSQKLTAYHSFKAKLHLGSSSKTKRKAGFGSFKAFAPNGRLAASFEVKATMIAGALHLSKDLHLSNFQLLSSKRGKEKVTGVKRIRAMVSRALVDNSWSEQAYATCTLRS